MNSNTQTGNILRVKRGIIVHQCNAQGKMGKGLAKSIVDKWPYHLRDYQEILTPDYQRGKSHMGKVVFSLVGEDLLVAGIIGQQFYGNDKFCYTDYAALQRGFREIASIAMEFDLPIHYPLIGCGLAGGDWNTVRHIIDETLQHNQHTLWTLT